MTKIIMHGACGRMGKVIADIVSADTDSEIVAGIDVYDSGDRPFPVYTDINECSTPADVIIDFSNAGAVDGLISYATERKLPVVLCTTALTTETLDRVRDASKEIAILKSANMSLGINTVISMLGGAAKALTSAGFDVEIVERHHNQKLDAPSGTAIALADAINEASGGRYEYIYDRSERREKRGEKELGISAVRGGTIPGTHEIIFAGTDELIEIKHVAYSRTIFATGAVSAAKFLAGKRPGMYDMSDVIAARTED